MKLKIANNLSLPVDVVTQTMAVLAKRRAGKSYTMRRTVEQLFMAGQQVVLVDPKGDQWGVRSAADGKGPGLPIVILGGERADVPLEASSGEVVAKLVVEERVSVLVDLSLFRKHEVATFMTGFLEALYRLKAREIYRTPMMLVIDEADAIAPQKPQKGEERMLGAAEDIVRRGGQRGIGCVLVTQRSAVLNKNVLTQAQILVALRTIAPQDLEAMKAWIDVHGTPEQRKTLMDSLPALPVGDAWFWSPGWPTADGIFKRVHVLPIETFDSGATPKPGEKRAEPKTVADVDLEALKRQMAATIEKAKAEDPRELRKQIGELKRQVAQLERQPIPKAAAERQPKMVEKPVLKDGQLARAEKLIEQVDRVVDRLVAMADGGTSLSEALRNTTREIAAAIASTSPRHTPVQTTAVERPSPQARRVAPTPATSRPARLVSPPSSNGDGTVTRPQQRILNALAWAEQMGLPLQRREKVAFLADASPKSSAYLNNLGALRGEGLIDYPQQGYVALTAKGRAMALVEDDAPISSREVQETICRKLTVPQAKIVRAVVAAYPQPLNREDVAARAEASPSSSAFMNNLGALRSLGLIEYPQQGMVAAQPVLFLEER